MAKKANKRFIKILAGSAIGLVLLGGGAYAYITITHNADYYVRKANVAMQEGKLLEARDYFGRAVNKQPSNPDLYMKLADVDERLVSQDPNFLQQAHQVWAAAVQVDPSYKPALNRLLDMSLEQVHGGATQPEVFSELRRIAELAARADPEDVRAQVYSHAATIQQWLNGAAFTNKAIDDQVATLEIILKRHPDSADASYYVGEAQLHRAKDQAVLDRQGGTNKAPALYDQLAGELEKRIQEQPKNGPMQLRCYQVLVDLLNQDRRPDHVQRYVDEAGKAIHGAQADIKPNDSLFDDSRYFYALFLRTRANDRKEIEKAYRDWMAARRLAAQPRLELASFLAEDAATRPEAIKILKSPLPTDPTAKGLAAARVRAYQRSALIALDTLEAEDARNMVKPGQRAQRDDLLKQIDADLLKITGYGFSEDYAYLRLRGKVEMLHGKPIDAIKTFERARTMAGGRFDSDLWTQLANAYLQTGQTGSATRLLEDVVARIPGYIPARIGLAELYVSRQQTAQADAQIQVLEKMAKSYPELAGEAARLRVALLTSQKQDAQAKQELSKLPEATKMDRLIKGELSAEAGDTAEAQRLFTLILKDDPADLAGVGEMVNLHMRQNHRDLALKVVADALKAKPNDSSLITLREGLNATTPEAVRKYQDQVANQIVDPFSKAIRQASLALDRQEYDQAARELDAADKIKPDDARTFDLRYESLRRQDRLGDAADLVDRAAKAGIDGRKGYFVRAKYALDRNDVPAALANARALVGGYGEFSASYLMMGRAQQAAGQYLDAIRSYNAALERQPGNVDAMRNKANCLDSLGRFDEEKTVIDAAMRLAPDNPIVRDLSLNYELYHGDPTKVVETCQDLVQKEPDNPTYVLALGQACTMVAQGQKVDREAARKYLFQANQVLTEGMQRFAGKPQVERFYAPLAQAMQLSGDLPGAEKLLLKFVALPDQKEKSEGYRQLAQLYERANRPDLAEQQWRTAYVKSGRSVDSEIDLSRFLANNRRIDEALKVLDDNADQPRILSQRIDVLLSAERIDQAKVLVDQVLAKNDGDTNARFQRGIIELRKNDAASAQRDLGLLRDKDPQNPNARLWLSRADRAAGDVSGAITELEAALKLAPTRSDIRAALLDAYSSGDHPRWDAFDQTIADAEADPRMSKDAEWTQIHARGLAKRGLYDQALAEIEAARKLDPASYDLRKDYATMELEARNYKEVLVETDKMLVEGHQDGLIYEERAVAKAGLGDKPGAMQEFDAAIDIARRKNDAEGVSNLLKTMRQFVGVDEALAHLDKCPPGAVHDLLAINLHLAKTDYASAVKAADALLGEPSLTPMQRKIGWQTKSECYYALKQYDRSRQAFDQLLQIEPDNWLVLNNVAYLVAEDLKQPQEALRYSGRAYELVQRTGGNPTVADTHGWVLTLCKGQDALEGLRILQRLADSPGVFPKARYHLAEAYLRQNKPDNAMTQLTLAKAQIEQMQQDHKQVDSDLKTTIQKAMDEIQKGKSQASSR